VRALFGADRATAGAIFLGDNPRPRRFTHPAQAVANGLVMVTEDRKQDGLLLTQSIRVNTTLARLHGVSRGGVISQAADQKAATLLREQLDIRCTDIEQFAGTLSGGNQQKVAVAKWLYRDGDVFLFDEPTRGIDMAARRRIYQLFETLAERGKALVIVSSDLEELMEVCDRIAVMSAGQWIAEFDRAEFSEEALTQAAFAGFHQHPTEKAAS
jgi:ribose transport system ATP-binding protein